MNHYQTIGGQKYLMTDSEVAAALSAGRLWDYSDGDCVLYTVEEEAAIRAQWSAEDQMAQQRNASVQRLVADQEERLQAKLDTALMALVDATPAQLITYSRNNFPSLSLAEQSKLGAILFAIAVAVRPQVR